MDASEVLRNEAKDIALRADHRTRHLKAQLEEIEARKLATNADLDRAKGAAQRLLNFQPRIGAEYQCPRCWIDRGEAKPLSSVGSPATHNILRCDACNADWRIPLR